MGGKNWWTEHAMPRTCTICSHPKRTQIDTALLRNDSLRNVVAQYAVSMGAVARHRNSHLAASIALAREASETEHGKSLLEQARRLCGRAYGILGRAEAAGQLDTALKAIREVRGIMELLGKLDGQIEERSAGVSRIEVVYVDKAVIVSPVLSERPPLALMSVWRACRRP